MKADIYITRWALGATGIVLRKGAEITREGRAWASSWNTISSNDFAYNLEDAQAKVKDMAERKLRSMRKAITRLEKLAAEGARVKEVTNEG